MAADADETAFESWVFWQEHPHRYFPAEIPYAPLGLAEDPEFDCHRCGNAARYEMHAEPAERALGRGVG